MPGLNLPQITDDMGIEELKVYIGKMASELEWLLKHLDNMNVQSVEANKITTTEAKIVNAQIETIEANKITTNEAKISTAQIDALVVGGNVTMGPNAYIAWGNVTDQPAISELEGAGVLATRDTIYMSEVVDAGSIATKDFLNLGVEVLGAGAIAYLNSISNTYIDDDSITTPKIMSGAITTAKLDAGAVTASKISVYALSAISADLGTVNAGNITSQTYINVGTDMTVGNNIYLGTQVPSVGQSKGIQFFGDSAITSTYTGVQYNMAFYAKDGLTLSAPNGDLVLNGDNIVFGTVPEHISRGNVAFYSDIQALQDQIADINLNINNLYAADADIWAYINP